MPLHLLFPLGSSLLYIFATLFLKRASLAGIDVERSTAICNWVVAGIFLLLLPLGGQIPSLVLLYQPLAAGALALIGQLLFLYAIDRGDVSVAIPVMAVKVILVAIFSLFLAATAIPLSLWIASLCSCLGVVLISRSGSGKHHRVGLTIGLSFASVTAFALFDVLVMKWAPAWGPGRFLPIMMGMTALLSCGIIPAFRAPLREIRQQALTPLLIGAGLLGLQALILVSTIAQFGDATAVNVVYSIRGLWSVLAAWLIGHWFHEQTTRMPARVVSLRLAGAFLLTFAVAMAFF